MSLALIPSQTTQRPTRMGLPASDHSVTTSSNGGHGLGLTSTCVNSIDLLRGQKAVEINHNGSTYRLQATRLGKLILTK